MSFENFLPEYDGAVAIPTIDRQHGLNAPNATVNPPGAAVPDVPGAAVAYAVCTSGR